MENFISGQKKILKFERRPPLKGNVRKRKIVKESDWKTYCGSSNELKSEVEKLGEDQFTFEIVEFCDTKWMMSYEELRLQMINNVLMRNDSYNGIINVRLCKFPSLIEKYGNKSQITKPF